jgi:hypothetical protein
VSVRHPRLPFGAVWVPILSIAVYALAWAARAALRFVPSGRLTRQVGAGVSADPARIGGLLTGAAWLLLCSGSYVLLDLAVPEERLSVKVRFL